MLKYYFSSPGNTGQSEHGRLADVGVQDAGLLPAARRHLEERHHPRTHRVLRRHQGRQQAGYS